MCGAGKWSREVATLGHGIATFDIMANALGHSRMDVCHFWNTRWKPQDSHDGEPVRPGGGSDALKVGEPAAHRSETNQQIARVGTTRKWKQLKGDPYASCLLPGGHVPVDSVYAVPGMDVIARRPAFVT